MSNLHSKVIEKTIGVILILIFLLGLVYLFSRVENWELIRELAKILGALVGSILCLFIGFVLLFAKDN